MLCILLRTPCWQNTLVSRVAYTFENTMLLQTVKSAISRCVHVCRVCAVDILNTFLWKHKEIPMFMSPIVFSYTGYDVTFPLLFFSVIMVLKCITLSTFSIYCKCGICLCREWVVLKGHSLCVLLFYLIRKNMVLRDIILQWLIVY